MQLDWFALATAAVLVVVPAWFWPHCARPALDYYRAGRASRRVGLVVTAAFVTIAAIEGVVSLFDRSPRWLFALFNIAFVVWLLVVGLTLWPRFSVLIRWSRGKPPASSSG